jgi:hypothetical protein
LAFGENPASASVVPAEREVIGRDVAVLGASGEAFLAGGELVHELEADVRFFGAEIDRAEAAGELLRSFPANLATEASLVAARMTGAEATHEGEKDGLDEVPIFGATGEESHERKILAFEPVDVGFTTKEKRTATLTNAASTIGSGKFTKSNGQNDELCVNTDSGIKGVSRKKNPTHA